MSQTEFRRYILSSEFKELLQRYEQTVASGEHAYFDTDDLIDIAEYYNIKKDIDASVGAAEYCLQQSPGEVLALQLLARTCLTEYKDAGQAQAYIDQLGDDNSAETVLIKAEALLLKDERQQAFDMLAAEYARLQEDAQTGGVDAVGYTDDEEDEEECQGDVLECFPLDVAMLLCDYDCFGEAERWMGGYSQAPAEMLFEYWETWGRIYHATGRLQQAADALNKAIDDAQTGTITSKDAVWAMPVPWCKMVRRDYVNEKTIQFDEVMFCNDMMFVLKSICWTEEKSVTTSNDVLYTVTTRRNSLFDGHMKDINNFLSRLDVYIRCNKFLKDYPGLRKDPILFYIGRARRFGIKGIFKKLSLILRRRALFSGFGTFLKIVNNHTLKLKLKH